LIPHQIFSFANIIARFENYPTHFHTDGADQR